MNRNTSTIIAFVATIAIFIALGVIAYVVGPSLAKGFIMKGNTDLQTWTKHYSSVAILLSSLSCLLTLLWIVLSRFMFKISSPQSVGRRAIWSIIGIINIVVCLIGPFIFIGKNMPMGFSISLLFFILFGIIGYYVCTLFFTPANYKYTPIGAMKIRGIKGGSK